MYGKDWWCCRYVAVDVCWDEATTQMNQSSAAADASMTSSHVTNLGWWLRSTLSYVEDGWFRFLLLSSALSSALSISILYTCTRRLVRVVRVLASARRMHSALCSKMECRELNRRFPVVLRYCSNCPDRRRCCGQRQVLLLDRSNGCVCWSCANCS